MANCKKDDFHDGYVLVNIRANRPYITLTENLLVFSSNSKALLSWTPYVLASLNTKEKIFIIEACGETSPHSRPFATGVNRKDNQSYVRWSSKYLLDPIKQMVGWNGHSIRILGDYYPEYNAIKFDLTDTRPARKMTVKNKP